MILKGKVALIAGGARGIGVSKTSLADGDLGID